MGLDMNYEAEVFVDTEDLSREDWLSYRRKGIGGSDAAAIMGMSPFCTKRDLYYDKLGIQAVMDEEEDNWVAKEVGHRLEDLVAEIFSRKTGLKVYPVRKMFRHPLCPFMLADVDFFIDFPDGSKGILECKTTNYNCQGKGMPSRAASLMSPPPIPPSVARETESRSRKPDKDPRTLCSTASGKAAPGQAYAAAGRESRHQGRKASRAALRILWCLLS